MQRRNIWLCLIGMIVFFTGCASDSSPVNNEAIEEVSTLTEEPSTVIEV